MTKQDIAQIAYDINRVYAKSIGDNSFGPWEEAPQWQKDTNLNGVEFHLANPNAPESASHENWMKVKTEEGWKYGPVKNPETKEHPCYVPYDQLPVQQQSKDFIFKQIVHSLKPFLTEESSVKMA
jgi:hypothetical protein